MHVCIVTTSTTGYGKVEWGPLHIDCLSTTGTPVRFITNSAIRMNYGKS